MTDNIVTKSPKSLKSLKFSSDGNPDISIFTQQLKTDSEFGGAGGCVGGCGGGIGNSTIYEKYCSLENENNFETKNIKKQSWKKAGKCEHSDSEKVRSSVDKGLSEIGRK